MFVCHCCHIYQPWCVCVCVHVLCVCVHACVCVCVCAYESVCVSVSPHTLALVRDCEKVFRFVRELYVFDHSPLVMI